MRYWSALVLLLALGTWLVSACGLPFAQPGATAGEAHRDHGGGGGEGSMH